MNEQVILITVSSEGNGFSRTESETRNTVWCAEESIAQREFFEANAKGLKAEYKLNIWTMDYNGELAAEYNGKRYGIYRTYKKHDITELYLASEG